MLHQTFQAAGYLCVLMMPVLLALGMYTGHQWLAVATLFGITPLLRVMAGDVRCESVVWREGLSKFLHVLPHVYAVFLFSAVAYCAWMLNRVAPLTTGNLFTFAASLWATLLTATVPAHELIHRPDRMSQRTARWILGVAGYPILSHEHVGHHKGHSSRAEWALATENVYAYSVRQIRTSLKNVWERDLFLRAKKGHGVLRGELFEAVLVTLLTALMFTLAAGMKGLALYAAMVPLMFFFIQLMAYIQHWGLGEANAEGLAKRPFGWEDACQVQAWLTLNLSFHESHHRTPSTPFYRLAISKNSPRLPAGYVVMMVAAFFPPVWRRLMAPALRHWQACPDQPLSVGRTLVCVNLNSLGQPSALESAESARSPSQAWEPPQANRG